MNRNLALRMALAAVLVGGCHAGLHLQHLPPSPPAALALAQEASQSLHQAGDPGRAEELARQALKQDPSLAVAHEVLAHIAMLRDDAAATFTHLASALADARSREVELLLAQVPLRNLGTEQLAELEALVYQISRGHPDPQSRAAALAYLGQLQLRLGAVARARQTLRRRAPIRAWTGIAGFDNEDGKGFDTPYAPEREIHLDRSYPGSRGEVRWRPVTLRGPLPLVELDQVFYPFSWNVSYLVSYVLSPTEQQAVLEITTSDPVKAWLNDRRVLAARQVRSHHFRQFRVPLRLQRGPNKLLIKSCVRSGRWVLGAWLTGPDGDPLVLPQSRTPRAYRRDPTRPATDSLAMLALPAVVTALADSPGKELRAALALTHAGILPAAITRITRYLEVRPRDPVALLYAAGLHRTEDQLQMASQLVSRGLRLKPPYAARFWVEQARHYQERGQLDKAFEALKQARTMAPAGAATARRLDALYGQKGWYLDQRREALGMRARYPDWAWPAQRLARCTSALGRPREANRWLKESVRLDPTDMGEQNRLADSYLALGQCGQALAVLRGTLSLWPYRPRAHLRLGDALRRCGRPGEALQAYGQALRIIPDWSEPYEHRGLVYHELGRTSEALEQWNLALKHDPEDADLSDRVTHVKPDQDPYLERFRPGPAEMDRAVARARRVEPAEGASVVWLLDHEVSRLMPDGTLKRVITTVRMAVDRSGRDSLGQDRLPRNGLIKVLDAYTVDRKGRRQEVTSMHGRTVRYPSMEEGSVVVLQYRHIVQPSGYLRQHLATTWVFQHNLEQVVRSQWILMLPRSRRLHFHLQGEIQHQTRREEDLVIHTFTADNVPPLRPERSSPPASELLRSVIVSTVPSWDYFSEWGRSLTSEVFELDPALRRILRELTASKKTVRDKIRAIYHFALTRIRYQQDYETFIAGVKPHSAATVLARGYGDCKDKSVLMIALFRELGLKAHLALVRVRGTGRVYAEVPSQQFNHAVVYLPPQAELQDRRTRFLDATAENLDMDVLRADVQGTVSLVLFPKAYRLIEVPYQEPDKDHMRMRMSVELAADGSGTAEVVWSLSGHMAGALRKPLQNRQLLQQYAQATVHQLFSDCSLLDVQAQGQQSILRPLELTLRTRCASAARSEEDGLRLRLPKVLSQMGSLAHWSERRHPIFFGPPQLIESELELRLPGGLSVRSHPPDLTTSGPCFEAKTTWVKTQTGLRYHQTFRRTCALLLAAQYPAFRSALGRLSSHLEREVVLKVAGGPK